MKIYQVFHSGYVEEYEVVKETPAYYFDRHNDRFKKQGENVFVSKQEAVKASKEMLALRITELQEEIEECSFKIQILEQHTEPTGPVKVVI